MSKFKVGDKVRFVCGDAHEKKPDRYPAYGTIGIATTNGTCGVWVQWPKGSTSLDDEWPCRNDLIELVEETPDIEQPNAEYLALKREFDHMRKKADTLKGELAEEKSKVDYLEGKVEAYRWCIDKMMGGV